MRRKISEKFVFVFVLAIIFAAFFAATAFAEEYGSFIYRLHEVEKGKTGEPYVEITSFKNDDTDDETVVTVPDSINKVPVTSIAKGAFKDNDKLTEVIIPKSVKYIDAAAFYQCKKLKCVILPSSVETVADSAFQNCPALRCVVMTGVKSIGDMAFKNCDKLVLLDLGDKLETIGDGAFYGCMSLNTLRIPKSVKAIGKLAFGFYEGDDGKPTAIDGDIRFITEEKHIPALTDYIGQYAHSAKKGSSHDPEFKVFSNVPVCSENKHSGDFELIRAASLTHKGLEVLMCTKCSRIIMKDNNDVPPAQTNVSGIIIITLALVLAAGFAVATAVYVKRSKARREKAIEEYSRLGEIKSKELKISEEELKKKDDYLKRAKEKELKKREKKHVRNEKKR